MSGQLSFIPYQKEASPIYKLLSQVQINLLIFIKPFGSGLGWEATYEYQVLSALKKKKKK